MAFNGKKLSHIIGTKYPNQSEKMREVILYAEEAEELLHSLNQKVISDNPTDRYTKLLIIKTTKLLDYVEPL